MVGKATGWLNRTIQMEEEKKVETKSYVDNPTVRERIVKISNEIRIIKAGKNEFTKTGYFQPDDILRAINPLLLKYDLFSVFNMTWNKEKDMYEGSLGIQDVRLNSFVEYKFDIPMQHLKGNAGEAQNAGATQTYCKRYMFMNAFNLADNKMDPDNHKPAGVAPTIDWEKKLKAAKSLAELQSVFASMPQKVKVELEQKKNILKAEFAK